MHLKPGIGAMVSATVWREAGGYRINIEYRMPDGGDQSSTHRVAGDADAVRRLIACEVAKNGFDLNSCGIWWKLKELIPLSPN